MDETTRRAYIEIIGAVSVGRYELTRFDLSMIGDFTRENVERWINTRRDCSWNECIPPVEDFHAVYGDMEIPWKDASYSKYSLWKS